MGVISQTDKVVREIPADDKGPRTTRYSWFVVSVLALASALAYLDRQIIVLIIEPIKNDLRLTDFQVSLLLGPAYVLFYATMGIPLSYVADRWSRRYLIAAGILLWSLATAVCGFARSFPQLLAARLSVGFGQASLLPAAYSLLPDNFGKPELPRAFGILQMGAYAGGGLALVAGGLIIGSLAIWPKIELPIFGLLASWQTLFLMAAAPGVVVAALTLTIREPHRASSRSREAASGDTGGLTELLARRKWFFIGQMGAAAFLGILCYAVISWTPSFFIRSFGWSAARIGVTYGSLQLATGISGTLAGGYIAEVWTRREIPGAPVRLFLWSLALLVPCACCYVLCSDAISALLLLGFFSFFVGGTSAVLPTILQLGTPSAYRARISGIYLFALTVFGVAGGPVAVAAVTDFVYHDPQRLNRAIAVVAATSGPIAFAFGLLAYHQFVRLNVADAWQVGA